MCLTVGAGLTLKEPWGLHDFFVPRPVVFDFRLREERARVGEETEACQRRS